ncbi:hypothetical protein SMAC4_13050 [Sordaria macrospora]|uniref:uncharacterized protein n=1 Tax=Sordaria macrospora TaxID=5147 RepID=UPI002B323B08|nr:hypothetical protein SMAC4_13050 [Sordaria macrospora]
MRRRKGRGTVSRPLWRSFQRHRPGHALRYASITRPSLEGSGEPQLRHHKRLSLISVPPARATAPVWWTSAGYLATRASRATRLLTNSLRRVLKRER